MSKWHGGKGSAPRPKSVDEDVFSANWAAAFGGLGGVPDYDKKEEPAPIVMIDGSGYAVDSAGVWHEFNEVLQEADDSVLYYENGLPTTDSPDDKL